MNKNQVIHPGEAIKEFVIDAYPDLNISKAAEYLKITRVALSRVLNQKAALTPDLAAKIEEVFGIKASLLLKLQIAYDCYYAKKKVKTLKLPRYQYQPHFAAA